MEYNTGVLFFTRDAAPLFARWKALSSVVDSAIDLMGPDGQPMVMPFNDQGSFAKAMIRPAWHRTFFGPIKIWHDYHDPPQALRELSAAYRNPNAIIRFHWM